MTKFLKVLGWVVLIAIAVVLMLWYIVLIPSVEDFTRPQVKSAFIPPKSALSPNVPIQETKTIAFRFVDSVTIERTFQIRYDTITTFEAAPSYTLVAADGTWTKVTRRQFIQSASGSHKGTWRK